MNALRPTVIRLVFVSLLSCVPAFGQSDVELLDELVAGSDANDQLLAAGGSAKYSIRWRKPVRPVSRAEFHLSSTGSVRYDIDSDRHIAMNGTVAEFDAKVIREIQRGEEPSRFSVFVRLDEPFSVQFVQFQWQGMPLSRHNRPQTIADFIRSVRRRGAQDAVELSRTEEGLVVLKLMDTDVGMGWDMLVSPAEGYCVREYTDWSLRREKKIPVVEIVSQYRVLPNGGYICCEYSIKRRGFGPEPGRVDLREYTVKLTKASTDSPDEALFTFAGMGVPPGVRLQDRIRMREYVYGVSPVTEGELMLPPLAGPDATRHWRLVVPALAALVLIVGGLIAWRGRRAW